MGTADTLLAHTAHDLFDALEGDLALAVRGKLTVRSIGLVVLEHSRLAFELQSSEVSVKRAHLLALVCRDDLVGEVARFVVLARGLVAQLVGRDVEPDGTETVVSVVHSMMASVVAFCGHQCADELGELGPQVVLVLRGGNTTARAVAPSIAVSHVDLVVGDDRHSAERSERLALRYRSGMDVLDAEIAEESADRARPLATVIHVVLVLVQLTFLRVTLISWRNFKADLRVHQRHSSTMVSGHRSPYLPRGHHGHKTDRDQKLQHCD